MKYKFVSALLLGLCHSILGQNVSAKDAMTLFNLPLEELLKVKVVSKTEENISQTPGIASVYYPEQLMAMGLHSVSEFLSFASSVEINPAVGGINPIQIRGLSDANNQKVLFLLDGKPYWMPSHGDIPINGIPLVMIEKIEVIRGPASVVYGTNSSSGVINIVTKSNAQGLFSQSIDTQGVIQSGLYHTIASNDGHFDFALALRQDDGYDAETRNTLAAFDAGCLCFPLAEPQSLNRTTEHASFLGQYHSDSLNFILQKYQEETSAIASGTFLSPAIYKQYGTLLSAQYSLNNDYSKTLFYSDWNQYYWRRDIEGVLAFNGIAGDGLQGFDNQGRANYRWRTGISYELFLSDNTRWLLGVENETRSTENNKFRDDANGDVLSLITQPPFNLPFVIQPDGSILLIDAGKLDETAFLAQLDHSSDNWRLVAGLRQVDNEFSGSHLSPRVSYIYSVSEQSTLKLLYSEGFNSPTFRQITGRNTFGIPQEVNVQAEIIETSEIAYTQNDQFFNQSIVVFYTRAKDLIQTSFNGISNSVEVVERSGAEYELQIQYSDFQLLTNVTYLKQGDQNIENDPTALFSSRWLVKLGGVYQIDQHSIGLSLRASSARAEVNSNYLLNSSYQYQSDQWRFYASIKNLLDEKVLFPDVRNQEAVIFQGEPERSLSIGLEYRF
ncbi:hypothetical protein FLL45_06255 [Aliikangiella marina]|uniref:TonB-dependent receptor n=1 Tax=Aliikangiella marina TaxID=1712262 RepID=A0A545TBI8_9GAMM|nr:TonB-dependent receptor [Aliikangiella marina]TQV74561.1 hypothetical protein FLL45_06255 [Aliikangiella marina]